MVALIVAILLTICIIYSLVILGKKKENFSRSYGQLGPSLLNGKLAEPNELIPLKKVQFFERVEKDCLHCT